MKKIKRILLLISILTIICPISVLAKDETRKLYINIDILRNGDIKVQELASLDGEYNGRLRNIEYGGTYTNTFTGQESDFISSDIYNGSDITDLKIYDVKNKDKITFNSIFNTAIRSNEYQEVTYASNGQTGVYEKNSTYKGIDLKIFNPSSNNTAFYMEYIVKNVVVVHNDVAEINWNILGDSYEENIEEFQVHVNLPEKDSSMRVWLKGNKNTLNGKVERKNDKYAKITYDFLGAYNPITVRMMFSKDLVKDATKITNVDAKESILKVEKRFAEEANAVRDQIKFVNNSVILLTIVWYLALIISLIILFYKKKQADKTSFDMDYLREFPATYGPETLSYLLKKKITEDSFGASLLMLIEKKVLKVENNPDNKKDFYLIKLENIEDITSSEEIILDLIINEIGNGEKVSLKDIKKYGRTTTKAQKFIRKYNKWNKESTNNAKKEDFFQTTVPIKKVVIILSLVGFLITIINSFVDTGFIFGYLAIAISIITLIITGNTLFRTEKGALQYKQWKALKKFLVDFGTMDDKELPEVSLWGKYLVYATVLGCAKTLEKQMKIKIQNMNLDDAVLNSYYWYGYHNYSFNVAETISSTMHQAVSASRSSIASSSSSSSGGFGGGSSFGGGFGGGGGGGGRF